MLRGVEPGGAGPDRDGRAGTGEAGRGQVDEQVTVDEVPRVPSLKDPSLGPGPTGPFAANAPHFPPFPFIITETRSDADAESCKLLDISRPRPRLPLP